MKLEKILTALFLAGVFNASAQNTFPTSGNVGIGTTTPQHKLTVLGNISASVANNEGAALILENQLKTQTNQGFRWSIYNMTGPYGNSLQFWNYSESYSMYGPRLTLTDDGSVGIGSMVPDNVQNWNKVLDLVGSGNAKLLVRAEGAEGVKTGIFSHQDWGGSAIGRIGTESNHDLGLMAGYGNLIMSLKTNGNVGIGTTTPAEKLSVSGKIRAKEIKVETANWPDYVFDLDYEILGLQELDAFIKQYKHLPDMPSAKEAEANGVELGELNKLLLKKVEELTLHLIEKDKALKVESAMNIENQKRIGKTEKELAELKELVNRLIKK